MSTYKVHAAEEPLGAVSSLATDVVDTICGYETLLERAEPDLKPVAQDLHDVHKAHAVSLLELVSELGGKPEDAGSAMGVVNTAVIAGRDWFSGLDCSALGGILDGERRLLSSYQTAAEAAAGHPEIYAVLDRQRRQLTARVTDLDLKAA